MGTFAVGTRIPTEMDLAQRLEVSRPVVREALARLRDEGLLASRQGSGSVVVRRPDRAISGFAPVNCIADIQRCFVFRMAVESEAAALAARNRDEAAVGRLKVALDALHTASNQQRLGTDEDFGFHLAVADASGNHFFTSTLSAIREQIASGIAVNRNLTLIQSRERNLTVQNEHQVVYAAIAAGDDEAARRAMREHIENARRRVFEGGSG